MSDMFQSGRHPDADQLSAFVEQALPAHERKATLAHLAVCAECRAVIALMQSAAEPVPVPAQKPERKAWLRGWNLAWPAAAALAGLTLVAVYVYRVTNTGNRAGEQTQIAVAPPPAPIAQEQNALKQAATPSASAQRNLPHPANSEPPAKKQNPAKAEKIQQKPTAGPSPARLENAPSSGGAGGGMGVAGRQSIAGQSTGARPIRSSPAPATAADENAYSPAPRTGSAGLGASVGSKQQRSAAAPAPAFDANDVSNNMLGEPSIFQNLPSGLPMLSTAVHDRKVMAIDTAHKLYLSDDGGAHWKPVTVPWKAHAVTVSLVFPREHYVAKSKSGSSGVILTGRNVNELESTQLTETLSGAVTDASGAAIPRALVVVTRPDNHISVTVSTDRKGRYRVKGLEPGTYDVEARAPGFQVEQDSGVTIDASRRNVRNFKLDVGAVSQTVTVTGPTAAETVPLERDAVTKPSIPPGSAEAASPVPSPLVPMFEVTTKDGSRWTSADGVTWTRQW